MSSTHNTKAGMAAVIGIIVLIGGGTMFYQSRANSSGITFQEAPKTATPELPATPQNTPSVSPKVTEPPNDTNEMPEKIATPASSVETIVVHVTGAVKKRDIVHLPIGARGIDAVTAVGGLTKDANPNAINLAAKLEDGSQLYIPTYKEEPKSPAEKEYLAGNAPVVLSEKPTTNKTTASTKPSKPVGNGERSSRSGSGKLTDPSQGMVNINKAGEEELQRLPGIGPAMAARVIAYRQESGGFQTPEDLMQVSGIGEKKFAKMKPFVKVK